MNNHDAKKVLYRCDYAVKPDGSIEGRIERYPVLSETAFGRYVRRGTGRKWVPSTGKSRFAHSNEKAAIACFNVRAQAEIEQCRAFIKAAKSSSVLSVNIAEKTAKIAELELALKCFENCVPNYVDAGTVSAVAH